MSTAAASRRKSCKQLNQHLHVVSKLASVAVVRQTMIRVLVAVPLAILSTWYNQSQNWRLVTRRIVAITTI